MMKDLHYRHAALQAGLRQVSDYYIEPDKKGDSNHPGISNWVLIEWKKKRIKELEDEIRELEDRIEEKNAVI